MLGKKYRQYFTITYYIKIEMSYQSATYNRTSGSFGIQINGTDSSSNSTGVGDKTVVLNAPGVWMVEIYLYITYPVGQEEFQATIALYENNSTDPQQNIVTSATNYQFTDGPNVYLPLIFGASFSKTYVVNDANPTLTITAKLPSDWNVANRTDGDLLMKATKLC